MFKNFRRLYAFSVTVDFIFVCVFVQFRLINFKMKKIDRLDLLNYTLIIACYFKHNVSFFVNVKGAISKLLQNLRNIQSPTKFTPVINMI